jgi:uncharacterized coiled-coil protein SlyX
MSLFHNKQKATKNPQPLAPPSHENRDNPYGYQPHQPTIRSSNNHMSSVTQQISARDQEIARLQAQVQSLTNQLESAKQQQAAERAKNPKRRPQMSPHAVHIQQIEDDTRSGKRSVIRAGRERMGRKASISTQQVMASLPPTDNDYVHHPVAVRVLEMFQRPGAFLDYLNSETFAKDVYVHVVG